MSAWTYRRLTARPPERLFRLVFESHSGRALVPIPKRSASPRATSTLQWRIGLKVLDPKRPIREADITVPLVPESISSCYSSAAPRHHKRDATGYTSANGGLSVFAEAVCPCLDYRPSASGFSVPSTGHEKVPSPAGSGRQAHGSGGTRTDDRHCRV